MAFTSKLLLIALRASPERAYSAVVFEICVFFSAANVRKQWMRDSASFFKRSMIRERERCYCFIPFPIRYGPLLFNYFLSFLFFPSLKTHNAVFDFHLTNQSQDRVMPNTIEAIND